MGGNIDIATGLVIEPRSRRLIWANNGNSTIAFSSLDGSGGCLPDSAGGAIKFPTALAIDPRSDLLYWGNSGSLEAISRLRLDGGGGETFDPGGTDPVAIRALAIDVPTGRLLWTSSATSSAPGYPIQWSGLDSPGEGKILDLGIRYVLGMVILRSPALTEPAAEIRTEPDGALSCQARWAPDHPEASFFRMPHREDFTWTRDGETLPEERGATLRSPRPGSYRCSVIGENAAGSVTSGESEPFALPPASPGPVDPDPGAGSKQPPASGTCSAPRLRLAARSFVPAPPYGDSGRVLGLRLALRASQPLTAKIRPRIRYRGRSGARTAKLRIRTVRIERRRELRFKLPRRVARQLRRARGGGPLRGARVTLVIPMALAPADAACRRRTKQTVRLKTRVVRVSQRASISRG